MKKNKTKNQSGMTLLEIIIVLAIIGAVASMLISKVMDSYRKAQVKQTGIMIGQVVSQIQLYYTDCGHYPASLENLVTADPNCSNWGPEPYLKKMPKDAWEHDLVYEADGGNFKVKSTGGPTNKEISSDSLTQ